MDADGDIPHTMGWAVNKENDMCDRYEYEHLMLEETMAAQAIDRPLPSDLGDNKYEESYEAHQQAVSSWVKRNLDGAQYTQPRGSQYEG